jgi:hypothetical protein
VRLSTRTDTREIHKIELGAEILRTGGSVRLRVLGTSMLPSIWPGDLVDIEGRALETLVPSDIILYQTERGLVVHRLLEKSQVENYLITRGDSMSQDDPMVTKSQLLGRVSSIRRNGRRFLPKPKLAPLMRTIGRILCYSDSLRNLALRFHSLRIQPRVQSSRGLARLFLGTWNRCSPPKSDA